MNCASTAARGAPAAPKTRTDRSLMAGSRFVRRKAIWADDKSPVCILPFSSPERTTAMAPLRVSRAVTAFFRNAGVNTGQHATRFVAAASSR